jgi:hypothetical protein
LSLPVFKIVLILLKLGAALMGKTHIDFVFDILIRFFVELLKVLSDRLVQLKEGKEQPVPQGGGNPG